MKLAALLLSFAAPAAAHQMRTAPVARLEKLLAGRAEVSIAGVSAEGTACQVEIRRQVVARDTGDTYAYGVAVIDSDPRSKREYKRYGGFYAYERSFVEWEKVLKLADISSALGPNDVVSLWTRGSRIDVIGEHVKPLFHDSRNPRRSARPSGAMTCFIEP